MTQLPLRHSPATLCAVLLPWCTSCAQEAAIPNPASTARFQDRWFQGKAEISRFDLVENRYGEERKGDAILIFVTEDFLREKQVKAERGGQATSKILKLNFIKKFTTGVYDYSMMSSIFTPIDIAREPHSLKLTASIQEWCGHVYQQLNLRGDSYRVRAHSYFESEGDEDFQLPAVTLEDEIWTRIRLAPSTLPVGECKMIPGAFDSRLRHRRLTAEPAIGKLAKTEKGRRYTIEYPRIGRSLSIEFAAEFPYEIESFEEKFRSGGDIAVTSGRRASTKMLAYWNHNDNSDDNDRLRKQLGLR